MKLFQLLPVANITNLGLIMTVFPSGSLTEALSAFLLSSLSNEISSPVIILFKSGVAIAWTINSGIYCRIQESGRILFRGNRGGSCATQLLS